MWEIIMGNNMGNNDDSVSIKKDFSSFSPNLFLKWLSYNGISI